MFINKNVTRANVSRMSALTLALGMSFAAAMPAQAADTQKSEWTTEKSSIVAGTTIAGAALGGPIGLVLGVAAGDWLGDNVNQATEVKSVKEERDQALAELTRVQQELVAAKVEAGRYQTLALNSLQLNVMFSTAGDTLTVSDKLRLDGVVRLLDEHQELKVSLAGFADPRGETEFNQKLSARRAASVHKYLESQGIEAVRIQTEAYGASRSVAKKNNMDEYAMERVVTIRILEQKSELASH